MPTPSSPNCRTCSADWVHCITAKTSANWSMRCRPRITRASMGRCQGFNCMPRIMQLVAAARGMSVKEYFVFFSILVLSALAGGRIWYFAAHWSGPQNIMLFFNPFKAGMVSLGVFIGGALGAIVYTLTSAKKTDKNWSLEFAKIADTIVAPTALALFIYRLLGCTIKGDIVGAPTLLPWCFKWTDGFCQRCYWSYNL